MVDFGPFQDLLTGFSQMSVLQFNVCIGEKILFSTHSNGREMPTSDRIMNFSNQIIKKAAFRQTASKKSGPLFGVPIRSGEKIIGSLIAHPSRSKVLPLGADATTEKKQSSQKMERFLTNLTLHMENHWDSQKEVEEITDELTQSFEDLNLYSRIATQIKSLRFSSDMLQHLIEELLETMRTDLAFVMLLNDRENDAFVYNEEIFKSPTEVPLLAEKLIKKLHTKVNSHENDYHIVNDSKTIEGFRELHSEPYRFLAVKIAHNDTIYGWLGLLSFNLKEIFRRSELSLMSSMAEQLAMVLANTELYHDLEEFVINVVKSLVYAIEAKDVYTRGHSERVNKYSMLIANRLELDKEKKNILHWASILHDVGKIGIPEAILNKPGPLNDDEFGNIKSHPQKGYDILLPLEQLSSSLPGILYHHERYDGNGYPHGLKGEEIPLEARIIAVADTFDAITSNRAYRNAKSAQEGLSIMKKVKGTQIDPGLFETFLEIVRKDSPNEKAT